ncbi:MAG: selenocysteine-specific translation elongation factor [Desulfocapsaceae bacterium]|jgi:selenocysteine-specific elongation factor|nr:selenocysteine-specific translation elongation factor [Desulfocapsaceae bacterium]
MREIVLGTAGHVDHGKTSLVRALTGIETDRLKEEQKRGITIELGFAYLDLPCGHRLGIVDVPGHEKFVKNMVAGVTGMDLLAFIIAADEGIMPQTREHFDICRLLGVKRGLVVITKKDMVDDEWLEMVTEEVEDFCRDSFLENAPIIPVSSVSGEGISQVIETIDQLVKSHQFSEAFGPFRLPIDRVFAMKGFGAVVTGSSISGRAAVGDEMRFYPSTRTAKIRGIQVHSQAVDMVEAGHRTAINLQGVDIDEICRGMVVAPPGSLEGNYMLDCSIFYLPSSTRPLKHRSRVRVHLGTAELMGRVSLLERDELKPGEEAFIQLLLEEPVAVWPGDRYVIRSYSPVTTIGGGEVLGNQPNRKRKRLAEKDRLYNREVFSLMQSARLEDKVLLLLKESGMSGLSLDELAIRLGLFGKQLSKILNEPLSAKRMVVVDSATQRYLLGEIAGEVVETILGALARYHQVNPLKNGLSKEELRSGFPQPVDPKVFTYCLNDLMRKNQVVQEDSLIRLASHQVALKADEEKLKKDISAWYAEKGLKTATIKETAEHFSDYPGSLIKEVLDILFKEGTLVKVSETLYYDAAALENLQSDVVAFMQAEGEIDAPRFKNMSGLSRKFSIPILEYFDRIKLTIRVGDKRVLRKKG